MIINQIKSAALVAAMLLGIGSVSAQSKIDAYGLRLIDRYKAGQLSQSKTKSLLASPARRGGEALVNVLVRTNNAAVLDSLGGCGYAVEYISPSFSVVSMPVDGIETLARNPEVKGLSFGHKARPLLDKAHEDTGVSGVHNGIDLPKEFRGEGVMVGMFDGGFDPSHINWLSEDGKDVRLKYYVRFEVDEDENIDESDEEEPGFNMAEYREADDIRNAPTDDEEECHGTHVAGIMAGAYNGAGVFPAGADATKVNLRGVAPEADMAIAAGLPYNSQVLLGLRKLIDFADSQKKPIAINLSFGGNTGRHDGKDEFSLALDELGKEAVICVAAGNAGADDIHLGKTFDASCKDVKGIFKDGELEDTEIDVWSSDNREIKVSIILVDPASGEIVAKISSKKDEMIVCGEAGWETGSDYELFSKSYSGSIGLMAVAMEDRFNVNMYAEDVAPLPGNKYLLGLMIEGREGVRADAYCAGGAFDTDILNGFTGGDNNGSINSMACGQNIIVVGSHTTRSDIFLLNGIGADIALIVGEKDDVSPFSSWGELIDGRTLPHITAPGSNIYSSFSGPYVALNGADKSGTGVVASAKEGDVTHYWGWMCGTSMATPYVTGTAALMLQANPTLDVTAIRDILMETARKDSFVGDDEIQWGAGKLDVMAALRKVLDTSGTGNIPAEDNRFLITTDGLSVDVLAGGASGIEAQLHTMSGTLAASAAAPGNSVGVTAPAKGIYILSVKTATGSKSYKIVVK